MNLFIDNNLPLIFASVFDGYLRESHGGCAQHARSNGLGIDHDTPDTDWMRILLDHDLDWVVLTNDHKIRKNPVELEAWRNSGLKIMATKKSFVSLEKNIQIAKLFTHLPTTVTTMFSANPSSVFEVNANGKLSKV